MVEMGICSKKTNPFRADILLVVFIFGEIDLIVDSVSSLQLFKLKIVTNTKKIDGIAVRLDILGI